MITGVMSLFLMYLNSGARNNRALNPLDSGRVDIHEGDLVPYFGEHCRLHQSHVADAEDTDLQCFSL